MADRVSVRGSISGLIDAFGGTVFPPAPEPRAFDEVDYRAQAAPGTWGAGHAGAVGIGHGAGTLPFLWGFTNHTRDGICAPERRGRLPRRPVSVSHGSYRFMSARKNVNRLKGG